MERRNPPDRTDFKGFTARSRVRNCSTVRKPQNIMLLQDGTIKVTDFGIARFSDKSTRTMTEQAIGSVHYIAPEQARGDALTEKRTFILSV